MHHLFRRQGIRPSLLRQTKDITDSLSYFCQGNNDYFESDMSLSDNGIQRKLSDIYIYIYIFGKGRK